MLRLFLAMVLHGDSVVLENPYVRVTRGGAQCASVRATACDRVIVALGDVLLEIPSGEARRLKRGEIAVFTGARAYGGAAGDFFQVTFKPSHPPVQAPRETIRPAKNAVLYESERLYVFEERLEVGDTRARHSHNPRVVIQLNRTRLQQWPEGEAEVIREVEPEKPAWNAPVIHTVKNVGALPLRGIVLELKR